MKNHAYYVLRSLVDAFHRFVAKRLPIRGISEELVGRPIRPRRMPLNILRLVEEMEAPLIGCRE